MNPKQSFQEGPYVKEWENIAESKAFREATEAALLKLTLDCDFRVDSDRLAFDQARICGARDLVKTLSGLHLMEIPKQQTIDKTNLRHDV